MSALRPGGEALTLHALSYCHINANSRLLDIGCGNGESLALIREQFACEVAGLEPDRRRRLRATAANPAVDIRPDPAEQISFGDQSFDIVLAECTASLFEQPKIAFTQISRVLSPGGSLILTDVYATDGQGIRGEGMIRHVYTREEFIALLEACGFAVRHEEDCGQMLKTMLGQLILDHGAAEAYRMIGLDHCRLKAAKVGYILIVAEKEKQ